MDYKESVKEIKAFWDNQAANGSLSAGVVTHRDLNQRLLENEIIFQQLPRDQVVLDVGCGNGYSTVLFSKVCRHITGIDYSAAMIARAKKEYGEMPNVEFQVQDILNLDMGGRKFDAVIAQRCLINLAVWEAQQKAIANIAGVLKPGGYFLLQEGSVQGREKLNLAREMVGLPRMPSVPFNLDFDEDKLWPFILQYFQIVQIRRFGLYDLIARVVHPLLVSPEEPTYDAKINHIAHLVSAKMDEAGQVSREFSAVLRRL